MKYIIHLLITGIAASLFSCESLITTIPESKLPKGTEKVVLHSYITPQDTVILVKLTLSSPLLGIYHNNGFGYSVIGQDTVYYTGGVIENASITISDSKKQSANIPYIKSAGVYMLDASLFPILAGETYTIKAETPKGTVEATCTVPKELCTITTFKIDSIPQPGNTSKTKVFSVNFDWKDIADKANYYSVKASLKTVMLIPEKLEGNGPYKKVRAMVKYNGYWDEENGQEIYQSDLNRDGTTFSSPNGGIIIDRVLNGQPGYQFGAIYAGEKITFALEVLNTEKNYYDYHRAVRINNRQDGNPFVEPAPIPTNVKNGLGCFAASNKSILTVVY